MLDETDIKIVRKLQDNSRISFKKLAEELDLSVDTVIRRFNNLKQRGKIRTCITLGAVKARVNESDWHFITLKPETDMLDVINKLSKMKGVVSVHSAIGNYDILVETLNPSFAAAREVEKKILELPEVYRIVTRIYYIPENGPVPLSRPWKKPWIIGENGEEQQR
jgi:DNA-binding Lrp family transcriptional regulator